MFVNQLISAIEVLSSNNNEPTSTKDAIKQDYKNKTKASSISKSFKEFITTNSENYEGIKQTQSGPGKNVYVYKNTLNNVLYKIYDARSRYLHDGTPMIFSTIMYNSNHDWHFSGNVSDKKLPYEWWFEGLVRYCIQKYFKIYS